MDIQSGKKKMLRLWW